MKSVLEEVRAMSLTAEPRAVIREVSSQERDGSCSTVVHDPGEEEQDEM